MDGMGPDQKNDERRITYFAATHTRGKREMFGIRAIDRGKHMYVIGKTGMGKSTMLENLAIQDIQNGEGIAFIDPHGSTAEKLLDFVPHDRINDVIYFAPFDTDYPLGFNVMEDVGYDKRHLVVSGLMGAFKRIWVDAWSARMEYILQNTLLALLEYPGSTLLDVNRMMTNKTFRAAVIEKITDPIVRAFWTEEFANFTDTYTREATPAIQNKIGQFTANPLIRNIVGQPTSSIDIRKAMDEKKIFIVNLSKGRMGESNASLLGSMLTVKIYLAAMSRADEPASRIAKLPRFYFYVDEFQSMMNEAFADILSEARKYKLALTLANQYIEQMEEKVREAVFGNIGTLICFRVGPFDAEVLKTVFEPTFEAEDLVGLGIGQIYLTLMIDGVGSAPFSAETIPPIDAPSISYREDVITQSREKYGRVRAELEAEIARKQSEFAPPPPKPKGERRDMSRGPLRGREYGSREEAGTFDRRTGEFVRRDEPRGGYSRDDERPSRFTEPAQALRGQTEEEKRDALRAAILGAAKSAVPAPAAAAPAPTASLPSQGGPAASATIAPRRDTPPAPVSAPISSPVSPAPSVPLNSPIPPVGGHITPASHGAPPLRDSAPTKTPAELLREKLAKLVPQAQEPARPEAQRNQGARYEPSSPIRPGERGGVPPRQSPPFRFDRKDNRQGQPQRQFQHPLPGPKPKAAQPVAGSPLDTAQGRPFDGAQGKSAPRPAAVPREAPRVDAAVSPVEAPKQRSERSQEPQPFAGAQDKPASPGSHGGPHAPEQKAAGTWHDVPPPVDSRVEAGPPRVEQRVEPNSPPAPEKQQAQVTPPPVPKPKREPFVVRVESVGPEVRKQEQPAPGKKPPLSPPQQANMHAGEVSSDVLRSVLGGD